MEDSLSSYLISDNKNIINTSSLDECSSSKTSEESFTSLNNNNNNNNITTHLSYLNESLQSVLGNLNLSFPLGKLINNTSLIYNNTEITKLINTIEILIKTLINEKKNSKIIYNDYQKLSSETTRIKKLNQTLNKNIIHTKGKLNILMYIYIFI